MLRTTRSYVAIILFVLILSATVLERLRMKRGSTPKSSAGIRPFLRVSAAILAAETLLLVAGFPLGLPYFFRGVILAIARPAAVRGTAGLADRVLLPPTKAESDSPGAWKKTGEPAPASGPSTGRMTAPASDPSPAKKPGEPAPSPVPSAGRSESRFLGVVRRLAGPYIWTPPTKDWLHLLVTGDIASYLSVPAWYFALAFGGMGVFSLLRSGRWLSWLVASLCVVFGGVLLAFNMSFRQRDMVLLPFLLLAAVVAWSDTSVGVRRRVLAIAGLALCFLAAAYWGVRLMDQP